MAHKEFNFHIYNTTFYGQCWKAKNTKAVIVLAHGMGEHSGRYIHICLLYTSPSPRDRTRSRMPSSA